FLVIAGALGGRLGFGDLATRNQDEVRIGIGGAVFVVVQIQHRRSLIDAAAHGRDLCLDRIVGERAALDQAVDCEPEGDPRAGDRRGARAAVGLYDVAIEGDLTLAELLQVDHGAQAAADKALNFLRTARLTAFCRLPLAAGMRCARQHRVFGRDPTFARTSRPWRRAFLDACRAEYARIAETDQA